jgi:nitroreductase
MRRSLRFSYDRRPVELEKMEELREFSEKIPLPFEHGIKIHFFKSRERNALANNLLNPPEDCVAFIAATDLLSLAKTGFVGELFLLYATGLGLSTCWFGHYLLDEIERLVPDVARVTVKRPRFGYGSRESTGRHVICLSPLGYPNAQRPKMMDRLIGRMLSSKRKLLAKLLICPTIEADLAPELLLAFDLARKAPSAANKQHWEFGVSMDQKRITISMPKNFNHPIWEHPDVCVGCCAAHFWLGLMIQGIISEVTLTAKEARVVWTFILSHETQHL